MIYFASIWTLLAIFFGWVLGMTGSKFNKNDD